MLSFNNNVWIFIFCGCKIWKYWTKRTRKQSVNGNIKFTSLIPKVLKIQVFIFFFGIISFRHWFHLEINSAFRKYVCDMKNGFIESFNSISSILHNKSARSSVSISTQSSFFLRFDFLAKMFPELYFRRMSEKISQPYNSLVSLDMKLLSFKTLSWRMSLPLYLISHKKDCFDCKNCPLFWHALCAFSCKSVWRGLSLLEEAVTVDSG